MCDRGNGYEVAKITRMARDTLDMEVEAEKVNEVF